MAALVLGVLTQASDKTPWLAALLSDRYRAPGVVILAAAVALAVNYALGVVGGLLVAALLTPEARLLLLALALVLAGLGTAVRDKAPDALEGWRVGRGVTVFAGLFIMVFGDRMQFIVAALAARSVLPWAAAVGATAGALVVTGYAAIMGERAWRALPLRAIRIGAAAILTVAGVVTGLRAVALI
jgi:putative Ca2+/H+ antiporter (TMEM165/GDT1 family)